MGETVERRLVCVRGTCMGCGKPGHEWVWTADEPKSLVFAFHGVCREIAIGIPPLSS